MDYPDYQTATPDRQDETLPPPRRRRWLRAMVKTLALLLTLGLGLLSYEVISSGTSPQEVLRQIGHLIASQDRLLQGEADGRINILLLGVGGTGHDGPLLTDSMLLVSFRPTTQQVALISIPRDLLAPLPGNGMRRINSTYALAELNAAGQGSPTIRAVVGEVFGVPIHYSLLLDFSGFTQLIDTLGGVTIDVEHPLDDESYPIAGKENAPAEERYEHLFIPAGRQRMDGALALKYVRSRKAKGAQGSDFARSHRQQQVVAAVRDQVAGWGTLRPGRIAELLRIVADHLDTNLEAWEMLRLYELGKTIDPSRIIRHVLDDRPNGLLVASTAGGAYVLVPTAGDFGQLQQIALNPFTPWPITQPLPEGTSPAPTSTAPRLQPPSPPASPRLQIHNGTEIPGLGGRTERYLQGKGYTVVSVGNAPTQTYLTTVIYDLRPPAGRQVLRELGTLLDAVTFDADPPAPPPEDAPYPLAPSADVLIILGRNAAERVPE